jgi:3-oxoacyl-[acyl-carrier-protein] synthase-3
MTYPLPIRIAGLGRYLPERVVTNEDLEERCGLAPGWVELHNGVRERRWADPASDTNANMAARAAREALAAAQLEVGDLDLIVYASGTPQQPIPDTAPLVQVELGLGDSGISCFSVHATCLSFIPAVDIVAHLMAAGRYKRALIVSAEMGSVALNFAEPESCTLIGDAAAAAVLVPANGEGSCIEACRLETYGDGARLTEVRGGGTRVHPNDPQAVREDFTFHMDGLPVLREALRHSKPFLERLSPGLSGGLGDIDLVIPHQASLMGMQMLERFGWPADRIVGILPWAGNCIAASMPSALYEAVNDGRLRRGDRALLVGTGAGLSLGGLVFTY